MFNVQSFVAWLNIKQILQHEIIRHETEIIVAKILLLGMLFLMWLNRAVTCVLIQLRSFIERPYGSSLNIGLIYHSSNCILGEDWISVQSGLWFSHFPKILTRFFLSFGDSDSELRPLLNRRQDKIALNSFILWAFVTPLLHSIVPYVLYKKCTFCCQYWWGVRT